MTTTSRARASRVEAARDSGGEAMIGLAAPSPAGPVELSGQDRLHVILDMLHSVETLTLAGQRHTIVRIVDLLDEEIVRRARAAGDSVLEAIALLLPRLRCEAERLLPDIPTFVGQAELLIDTLGEA